MRRRRFRTGREKSCVVRNYQKKTGQRVNIIVRANNGTDYVKITVPTTIVTAAIATAEDWQKYIIYSDAAQTIDGYYVLKNDISASSLKSSSVPANINGDMQTGFRGTLEGRGHTLTIEKNVDTGYGIFGVLGNGAIVKNINIVNNSERAPGWSSNILFGAIATNARVENVTVQINNAPPAESARYGTLTRDGLVNCTFINTEFIISGNVQSLSGGSLNEVVGLNNTAFIDCTISFLSETSSLNEVGHNGSTVYVYKWANAEENEIVLSGIKLKKEDSGTYLIYNNDSEYVIVLPYGASATLQTAAGEMVKYFKEAAGVSLDVIDDSAGITHDERQTYLSLGNTTLYRTAALAEPSLKINGYRLYTKDRNVYITGGSDKGVLYGVYGLLGDLFGLDFYSEDCYAITETGEALRPDYDKTFTPGVDLRAQTGIVLGEDKKFSEYSDHLQCNDYIWAHLMPIVSAADDAKADYGHNSLYYLPKSLYYSSHPSFYSDQSKWTENDWGGINAQLCYTARGDSAEYAEMVRLCAERIEYSLQKYVSNQSYDAVMLGMEDNYYTCKCSACTAITNQYGSPSAAVILFLDDVADLVEAWMKQNPAYARDLQYMFFAYQTMLKAPDTMPAVNHKIVPLVAFSEADYTSAPTDTTARTTAAGTLSNYEILGWAKKWGAFAVKNGGSAWAWTYGNFYRDYFAFYDSYTFYADIFKYLDEYGYGLCYVQQQSRQRNAYTAFYSMNQYVTAKLAANSALDMNTLIDAYLSAMYKDAATAMKELFEKWRSVFAEKLSGYSCGYDGVIGKNLVYTDVSGMLDILDKAYAAIAKYETSDPELYKAIKRRIDLEWLSPAKMALIDSNAIKGVAAQKTRFENIRTKFKEIAAETGIAAASEFNDIQALIDAIDAVVV